MLYLSKDLKDFIKILNRRRVQYLIVGGWAFSYYATPRFTGDIDFFVHTSLANSVNLKKVLEEFGYGSLKLKEDAFCGFDKLLQIGLPPNKIDIFTHIPGIVFSKAWYNRVETKIDRIKVNLISKKDLIKSKQATKRLQDKSDLEELKK